MRIIYLLLIVCLGLVTAKYLPNESASLTHQRRHLRSIEDDSAATNEDKSDNNDDSGEDTSEEGNMQKQPQEIEKERQEMVRKQEEQKSKQEEEQLKQQAKIEKEERKKQEKIEKEERKRHEKQEKEERKHQERIEKEKRKQEEADRRQQEKIEKEERKRLEKLRKQLEKLEKDTLESNQLQSDSSESLEANESNESMDLEDIWRNHIYAKYGLSVNSTALERKTALNKYSEEELGLNVNSTKSERRLAVIKLIQDNLNKDVASQDALRNYILRHINSVAIQQLQVKLGNEIAKLNNDSVLLENGTMPWVPEAKQTIDEKRTLIQSVLQFLSHLLPNWATGGQAPSNINSNTPTGSQGTSESSGSAMTAASNVNKDLLSSSGAASAGAPEPVQGSAVGSVDVNEATNSVGNTSSDSSVFSTSDSISINHDSTTNSGAPPTGIALATGSSASGQQTADPINVSTGGAAPSSDNSSSAQESVSSANDPTLANVSPPEVTEISGSNDSSAIGSTSTGGNSGDNLDVAGVQDSISGPNNLTQEHLVPSDEIVPATGPIEVAASNVETPATSSIDVSANGVSTSDNSAAVSGPDSDTQDNSVPSAEAVLETGAFDVVASDVETPATSTIDGIANGVSTSGSSVVVSGLNDNTQESSDPSAEANIETGAIDVVASDVETPAISSIDVSANGVSTSGSSAVVYEPNSNTQENSVPSGQAALAIGPIDVVPSDVETPATSTIDGIANGVSTSGSSVVVSGLNGNTQESSEPSAEANIETGAIDVVASDVETPAISSIDVSANGVSTSGSSAVVYEPSSNTQGNSVPSGQAALAIGPIDVVPSDVETPATSTIDGIANGVSTSGNSAVVSGPNGNTQENSVPSAEAVLETGAFDVVASDVETPVTSSIDGSANGVSTSSNSAGVTGSNSNTQESSVPSGKAALAIGPIDVVSSDVETPATSNIDGIANGVSTTGNNAVVSGPNSNTQENSVPSGQAALAIAPIDVVPSDVETPATSTIDGIANGVSTSGNSAVVSGPNGNTQENSVPSAEAILETGAFDVVASDVETPATSSIDGSANGVSTSGNSAGVTVFNSNTQESSVPSGEASLAIGNIDVVASDVETPATSSIDGSADGVSGVTGSNSNTQESSILSGEAVPATGPVDEAASNVEVPASSSIDGVSIGVSTSADNAATIRPIETESPTAQESTTGVNEFTIAGAGTSKPVDVSSTGTIAHKNPSIGSVDDSSIGANIPVTESDNVVLNAEPAVFIDAVSTSFTDSVSGSGDGLSIIVQEPVTPVTTDSSVASPVSTSATVNIDVASAGVEQATTDSVDKIQINSEPNEIESSVNSIGANSTVESEAGPIDVATAVEVPVADVTDVVTTIDASSADVLPNTSSPNIEVITGSDVVTESSSNGNATEAGSVITNISNPSTTVIVDVQTNSTIAASSVSGVSETTKVEIAPTISPDFSATDVTVTPEIVTVDNNVTPGYINVESIATTPEVVTEVQTELASVVPEVHRVPLDSSSIFFLPNEPGASVIEITPQ